jgi:hypothetical protein
VCNPIIENDENADPNEGNTPTILVTGNMQTDADVNHTHVGIQTSTIRGNRLSVANSEDDLGIL